MESRARLYRRPFLRQAAAVEATRRSSRSFRRDRQSLVLSWFSPATDRCDKPCYQSALDLGIADRVRFLGFVNQSALPAVYKAADLMVLPSEYEPFAFVVNEASCCGCPVAASDRVGATNDLIAPVNPDFVFPCGAFPRSPNYYKEPISDPVNCQARGQSSLRRMESWSAVRISVELWTAVERALSRTQSKDDCS